MLYAWNPNEQMFHPVYIISCLYNINGCDIHFNFFIFCLHWKHQQHTYCGYCDLFVKSELYNCKSLYKLQE